MSIEDLKIIPPEGMEWYQEGNEIKFRPIGQIISYEDVAKKLFLEKKTYFINDSGNIRSLDVNNHYKDPNNCTSEKQAQKLLAINKLMNVAKYLNKGETVEYGYYICIYENVITNDDVSIDVASDTVGGIRKGCINFETEELARQAIEILGEETIKLALSTDW